MLALFFDLKIVNGNFSIILYTKHDAYPFSIVCTPNNDCNISPKLFTHSGIQKRVKTTTNENIFIKHATNLVYKMKN